MGGLRCGSEVRGQRSEGGAPELSHIPISHLPSPLSPLDFVELHCHSVFSLLDGASEPEALVARAKELGMPALALTDHDDLGGAVRFAQAARELGLGGIIGAELTVLVDDARTHLVVLAESREGYGNLCTLITRSRMDSPRGEPAIPLHARQARERLTSPMPRLGPAVRRQRPTAPARRRRRRSTSSRGGWRSRVGPSSPWSGHSSALIPPAPSTSPGW